ncbi:unnamed protein product, partial [Didymodactylos carnosus]
EEKSSVLEALSGILLPRAQNICTRYPLESRLKTLSETSAKVYATVHCLGQKKIELTDFNDINKYVITLTNKLAGTGFNVVSTPIILKLAKDRAQTDLELKQFEGEQAQLQEEEKRNKTRIEEVQNLIQAKKVEQQRLDEVIKELQDKQEQLQQEVAKLQEMYEENKERFDQIKTELEKLREQLQKCQDEKEQLEEQSQQLEKEKQQIELKINQIQLQINQLEQDIKTKQEDLRQIAAEIRRAQEEIREIQEDIRRNEVEIKPKQKFVHNTFYTSLILSCFVDVSAKKFSGLFCEDTEYYSIFGKD